MPTPIFYTLKETSIGVFVLTNLSANLPLEYILSTNNGCGEESLVQQGELGVNTNIVTIVKTNVVTFSNLPDGIYKLKLTHQGLSSYPDIIIKNFAKLENSILTDIKRLFGNCTDCSTPDNLCCLLNKMNYYFFLKELVVTPSIFEDYKCNMMGDIDCSLNEEFFHGKCETNLEFIISFYYLLMYNNRILENKIEIYNYNTIYKYISTNIINLS